MERREGCGFYHVCTNGTVLPWMFKDEQDFIAGINRIGLCKVISAAEVWAYTLMDNHIHLLLYGTLAMCKTFIDKYKFLTGIWIAQKYHLPKHIKELPASIIPLKTEEDILETISYIDRNPIVAGFRGIPQDYPWASSHLLFRKTVDQSTKLETIKNFSKTQIRDLLKTRILLPEDWTLRNDKMIDPACFTEWEKVETLFKTPVRYLYYLTKKLEGKINLTLAEGPKSFISDKDLRVVTKTICKETFKQTDIRVLDIDSRLVLARRLRREYASTPKQIARMLHLNAEILKDFI